MVMPCAAPETVAEIFAVLCFCVSWFIADVVREVGSITQLKGAAAAAIWCCPVLLLRPLLCCCLSYVTADIVRVVGSIT
jgi:hypothetical protein